jgi:alanyl-tRNA synthetase
LDGETAFKLHDTFGFPLDLTADVCRERNVLVDELGFNQCMQQQRDLARAAGKFKMAQGLDYQGQSTNFVGYETLHAEQSQVLAMYIDGTQVQEAVSGSDVIIVLDNTPFYAESGGQVGDCGELRNQQVLVQVEDTLKIQADVFGHHSKIVEGTLRVGDVIQARVDLYNRQAIMRNHSATHLLHKALREVLGAHVQQKGSLVDAQKTRFDFTHSMPVTPEEIERVEQIVNEEILANQLTSAKTMAIEDAQKTGAMMLFGEKYGDQVRVLEIGSSKELCGGTHVQRTGDIGLFKISSESGVAAGIRRIEGVTGYLTLARVQKLESQLQGAAQVLKTSPEDIEIQNSSNSRTSSRT